MNAQFRWFKFDALAFLLDPAVMVLSLAEQGALVRLMAHASRQQPFASIPADPAQQAAMVGLTPARWGKMAGRVLALWVQQGDRWLCPMMLDLLTVETTTEEGPAVTPDRNANAQRQKRYRDNQRNADRNAKTVTRNADRNAKTVTRNADTVTQTVTRNADRNATVTGDTVTRNAKTVTLEGGKGGDLDLEKELDQEVKKRSSSSSAGAGASLPEFTSKPAAVDAGSLAETFPDRPASPPAEWLALAKADYPQADHSGEWIKFRNHFWPLTGDRRTLAKWQSAWLGWIGRAGSAVPKAATKTAKQPAGAGAAVNAPFQAEIDAMGYRPPTPEEHAQFLREMGETA